MGEKVNSQTSHHKNWFSVLLCYHSKLHSPFAVLIKATIKTFSCFIQKWLKPRRWAAKLDTAPSIKPPICTTLSISVLLGANVLCLITARYAGVMFSTRLYDFAILGVFFHGIRSSLEVTEVRQKKTKMRRQDGGGVSPPSGWLQTCASFVFSSVMPPWR